LGGVCKRADLVAVSHGLVPVLRCKREIVLVWLLCIGGCARCGGSPLDPFPVDRIYPRW
jgi:hypothetical protein